MSKDCESTKAKIKNKELSRIQANLSSVLQKAGHLFPNDKGPLLAEVTPVIGTHIGPGAACFVARGAKGRA